jgi:predicted ATPase
VVTLVGAGGIGKTAMALHVAGNTLWRDGAWLVDLAPIEDPLLVPAAIAQAFAIPDDSGDALLERIAASLKTKHALIVLDNCEHLVLAAADAVKRLVDSCHHVHVLATSRESLGLRAELPYRMPVLDRRSAVELFVARVRAALGTFELTSENTPVIEKIVDHVDGIALAIELAAPRAKVLSLTQLEQRLKEHLTTLSSADRTAQPRHKTVRALISWSYDTLSAAEQQLLRRGAIFRGSWTMAAIEALCSGEPCGDVSELLLALIDKSLLNVEAASDDPRYRLLEPTRQFVLEQLDAFGERDIVAQRHCEYFATVAAGFGNGYWQTDYDAWTTTVRRDIENLRAAVGWGMSLGRDVPSAQYIVAHLRWFWYTGSRREGRALLDLCERFKTTDPRLSALLALTDAVLEFASAGGYAASAAQAFSPAHEPIEWIEAVTLEGIALGRSGHTAQATALFERAIGAVRETGIPRLIGWVLSMASYWMETAHDRERARSLVEEAARHLRDCNDAWQLARLQLHHAEVLFAQGDADAALAAVRDAEAVFRKRGADMGLCVAVLNAAAYLIDLHRHDEAWQHAREGLELALRLDTAMPAAWAIGHLARLAAEHGDVERAARLLGHADAAYTLNGSVREPTEQRGYDRTLQLIHDVLTPERTAEVMHEGKALERNHAATLATSTPLFPEPLSP